MNSSPYFKTILVASASLLLASCSSLRSSVHSDIQRDSDVAAKLQYENQTATPFKQASLSDELWLGPFEWGDENSLKPTELLTHLTYSEFDTLPLKEVLSILSRDAGVQIALTESAEVYLGIKDTESSQQSGTSFQGVGTQNTSPSGLILTNPFPAEPVSFAQQDIGVQNDLSDDEEEIEYLLNGRKTLESWLDDIALKNGLFWNYTYINGMAYISMTGVIEAELQFEGLLTSTGDSEAEEAAQGSWNDLEQFTKERISDYGASHFSKSTGRIYIEDRPEVVDKIKRRIEFENNIFSKQIHYRIQLITVNLDESESYRGGMQGLYDDLLQTFSIESSVSLGSGVNVSYANTNPSSTLNGSKAQFSLNNTLTKRSNINEYIAISRNRSSVSRVIKDEESYVKTITTSTTDNGTVVSPEVEELEEGVEIKFLGTIQSNNRIALNLSFRQNYVKSRTQESYNSNTITLPKQNNTVALNQFTVPSSQSFVISDASLNRASNDSGPARSLGLFEFLFGASTESSSSSSVRFLIITPTIIEQGV